MTSPTNEPAPPLTDDRIKHLELIQAVIARMAGESGRMKRFALLAVGVLASAAEAAHSPKLAFTGSILALIFWALDARYLQQERWFRRLYDLVRQAKGPTDFALSPSPEIRRLEPLGGALTGWSTAPIYLALLAVTVFIAFAVEPASAHSVSAGAGS